MEVGGQILNSPMLSHGTYATRYGFIPSVRYTVSVIDEIFLPRIILLLTFSKKLFFRLFCWARNKWSFWVCERLIKGESLFMKRLQEAVSETVSETLREYNVGEIASLRWIRELTWIELRKWVRFTERVNVCFLMKHITQKWVTLQFYYYPEVISRIDFLFHEHTLDVITKV